MDGSLRGAFRLGVAVRGPTGRWAGGTLAGVAVLLSVGMSCAPRWEIDVGGGAVPDLNAEEARLLGELNPYVLAFEGALTPILCRWRSPATLGVALAAGATAEDRRVIEMALGAWEQAGLGLDFEIGAEPTAIFVGFSPPGGYSGATRTDCEVRPGGGESLEAELVRAWLVLRRVDVDALGRPVPLTPAERMGAALHELGHALGFQGHPIRGQTVMLASVDHVRRSGRRLLRGEPFYDAALSGLYRLPSGTRLGGVELPPGRTRELDRVRVMAARLGYRGPLLRTGDRAARIAWQLPGASELFFRLPEIVEALRDPESFYAIPGPAAAAMLATPANPTAAALTPGIRSERFP